MAQAALEGRVAIVTGAASGIGRALGEELARRGAIVFLGDVQLRLVQTVAEAIRESGGRAEAVELDVTDAAAVRALVDRGFREHGRLDYMFNNAGIAVLGEFRDQSLEDLTRVLDVNLRGVVNGAHAAYLAMVKQGSGHIVNTASMAGLAHAPGLGSYATAKHGVVGLSLSLRAEGAALGVKVTAVCPGFIRTSLADNAKLANVRSDAVTQLDSGGWLQQSAEACAMAILRGVERNKSIVVTPYAWVWIWRLARLAPAARDAFSRRMMERFRKQFRAG